jgi:hypothetical protein
MLSVQMFIGGRVIGATGCYTLHNWLVVKVVNVHVHPLAAVLPANMGLRYLYKVCSKAPQLDDVGDSTLLSPCVHPI